MTRSGQIIPYHLSLLLPGFKSPGRVTLGLQESPGHIRCFFQALRRSTVKDPASETNARTSDSKQDSQHSHLRRSYCASSIRCKMLLQAYTWRQPRSLPNQPVSHVLSAGELTSCSCKQYALRNYSVYLSLELLVTPELSAAKESRLDRGGTDLTELIRGATSAGSGQHSSQSHHRPSAASSSADGAVLRAKSANCLGRNIDQEFQGRLPPLCL